MRARFRPLLLRDAQANAWFYYSMLAVPNMALPPAFGGTRPRVLARRSISAAFAASDSPPKAGGKAMSGTGKKLYKNIFG